MPVKISGDGTITGLTVGGLPNGVVDEDTLANNAVTTNKILNSNVTSGKLASGAGGKLLQMVQSEITSSTNLNATGNSGQDWADIGQTQTITMLGASSKIILVVEGSFFQEINDLDAAVTASYKIGNGSYTRLGHDSAPDSKGLCGIYGLVSTSGGFDWLHHVSINYMHTPSSYTVGDILTYKLEYKANQNNNDWCGKDGSREDTNYIRLIEVAL